MDAITALDTLNLFEVLKPHDRSYGTLLAKGGLKHRTVTCHERIPKCLKWKDS